MNKEEEKYIGYLKYYGESSVKDGFLDIRKSAEALVGFDDILRYFLIKEDAALGRIDFEIPVRIRKGSWQAIIPEIIDKLVSPTGIGAIAGSTYLIATAKKAAEDGLFKTGAAKDVRATFRAAIKSAQWMIKIGSHLGTLAKRRFENVKINPATQEIQIPNERGEFLSVPQKYFEMYHGCPEGLFSKAAGVIESERSLEIGVYDKGELKKVNITEKEKTIFYKEAEEGGEIVLPELKHGQVVELEGMITRVTESVNTIGFQYQGHIIICKPQGGTIAKHKERIVSKKQDHVFSKAKIIGTVDRTDKLGGFKEKRPVIVFSEVISLENSNDQSLPL